MDEGRLEAEHGKLDYRDSSIEEEIRLFPHRKGADEPDPPGSDIRDGPNASDIQRDEWLLKTEPLQGALPKWNKGERPPVITDRTGVLDLEATGGVGGQHVEHHGAPTPLLPLEWQILHEAEAITPPRRGDHRPGSRQAPEPQSPPGGTRAVPQIVTDVWTRDVGSDRRDNAWSPGNVLVDTVARMQQDLTDLRAENRLLRTPVVHTSRQAAFTTTKVPRFGGTTSWEQYRHVFDAILLSNGWDDATTR